MLDYILARIPKSTSAKLHFHNGEPRKDRPCIRARLQPCRNGLVRTGDIMDTLNRRHHGHFCLFFGSQTGLEAKADALESEKYFG
ncbi:MAG: hypothetical protein WB579_17235, partial [Bryobacteraceae bacterium]